MILFGVILVGAMFFIVMLPGDFSTSLGRLKLLGIYASMLGLVSIIFGLPANIIAIIAAFLVVSWCFRMEA